MALFSDYNSLEKFSNNTLLDCIMYKYFYSNDKNISNEIQNEDFELEKNPEDKNMQLSPETIEKHIKIFGDKEIFANTINIKTQSEQLKYEEKFEDELENIIKYKKIYVMDYLNIMTNNEAKDHLEGSDDSFMKSENNIIKFIKSFINAPDRILFIVNRIFDDNSNYSIKPYFNKILINDKCIILYDIVIPAINNNGYKDSYGIDDFIFWIIANYFGIRLILKNNIQNNLQNNLFLVTKDKQTLKDKISNCENQNNCKNLFNIKLKDVTIYENGKKVYNFYSFYKKLNISSPDFYNENTIRDNYINCPPKRCSTQAPNQFFFETFEPQYIDYLLFNKDRTKNNIFERIYDNLYNDKKIPIDIPQNLLFYAYIKIIQYSLSKARKIDHTYLLNPVNSDLKNFMIKSGFLQRDDLKKNHHLVKNYRDYNDAVNYKDIFYPEETKVMSQYWRKKFGSNLIDENKYNKMSSVPIDRYEYKIMDDKSLVDTKTGLLNNKKPDDLDYENMVYYGDSDNDGENYFRDGKLVPVNRGGTSSKFKLSKI
jgi:hypothetical protein